MKRQYDEYEEALGIPELETRIAELEAALAYWLDWIGFMRRKGFIADYLENQGFNEDNEAMWEESVGLAPGCQDAQARAALNRKEKDSE